MKHIVGVGCDLIEIARIKNACQKNTSFIHKILLPSEVKYCEQFQEPFAHIAARFAAKEAVSKALGVGFGESLGFHDIEIKHNDKNKPYVLLSPKAQEFFRDINLEISLSHTQEHAMAYVIAFN
jgi:holo-[acyl-carrier protein] synthase